MPKTTKLFDWEVTTSDGEFLDVITMTRNEMKEYKKSHPDQILTEVGYNDEEDDIGDVSREGNSQTRGNLFHVRVRKRR